MQRYCFQWLLKQKGSLTGSKSIDNIWHDKNGFTVFIWLTLPFFSSRAKYGIDEMCRDQWNWASKNPYGYGSPDSTKQNGHQTNGSVDSSRQNGHHTNRSVGSPRWNGHCGYGSADSPKRNGHYAYGSSDSRQNDNGRLQWAESVWPVSPLYIRYVANPLSEIDVDQWVGRSYSIESMAAEFQFVVGKPIISYVGIYSFLLSNVV